MVHVIWFDRKKTYKSNTKLTSHWMKAGEIWCDATTGPLLLHQRRNKSTKGKFNCCRKLQTKQQLHSVQNWLYILIWIHLFKYAAPIWLNNNQWVGVLYIFKHSNSCFQSAETKFPSIICDLNGIHWGWLWINKVRVRRRHSLTTYNKDSTTKIPALGHFIDGHFIDRRFIDRTFHRQDIS